MKWSVMTSGCCDAALANMEDKLKMLVAVFGTLWNKEN